MSRNRFALPRPPEFWGKANPVAPNNYIGGPRNCLKTSAEAPSTSTSESSIDFRMVADRPADLPQGPPPRPPPQCLPSSSSSPNSAALSPQATAPPARGPPQKKKPTGGPKTAEKAPPQRPGGGAALLQDAAPLADRPQLARPGPVRPPRTVPAARSDPRKLVTTARRHTGSIRRRSSTSRPPATAR